MGITRSTLSDSRLPVSRSYVGLWTTSEACGHARTGSRSCCKESATLLACSYEEYADYNTYPRPMWSVSNCPDSGAPYFTVSASPRIPLVVIERAPSTVARSASNIWRSSSTRCSRSCQWTQTPESSLLLASLASAHALF